METAKGLAKGDVQQEIGNSSGDEIGTLASSFRELVSYLKGVSQALEKTAAGDVSTRLEAKSEQDMLTRSCQRTAEAVTAMARDMDALAGAGVDGNLAARADVSKHQGEFRRVVQAVNTTLDAILLPIGEGNRILTQISNGKVDELIAQTYQGDHEKMKLAVNNVAVVMQALQKELGRLTDASREGQLSERGRPEQFKGAYGEIVLGVNQMLDAILIPIGEGNRILAQISNGQVDELIKETYKGDHEKMKQAVNNVGDVIQTLQQMMVQLTVDAKNGRLSERAQPGLVKGAYAEIVQGVNGILDAVVTPLNVAAHYVERISRGDLPPAITEEYKGDFNTIKNNLNSLIGALSQVTEAAEEIADGNPDGEYRGAVAAGQADAGTDCDGRRPGADGVGDTDDCGRGFFGEPGDQCGVGAGVEWCERAGGFGGGGVFFDGGDGLEHQAECG